MLALKRFVAFFIDYLLIVAWGVALFAIVFATSGLAEPSAATSDKILGHLRGFFTMTVPVWLYFSLCEGLGAKATLGKRILKLSVMASLSQAMVRNLIRFLPWEIAHAGIWYVPGLPFLDPVPAFNLAVMILAMAFATVLLVSVLVWQDRGLHDRLARTRIVG